MSRGERIRRYRKMKGLTQKSLAEKIGLAESAVRNYELGLLDPSQETLAALSDALGVPMSALDAYELSSAREALEALFRLEDAFGLKPVDGETLALDPKAEGAQKLSAALAAWRGALDELEAGEMTQDEYERWRATFE